MALLAILLALLSSLVLAPSAMAEGETAGTLTTPTEPGSEQPATKSVESETPETTDGEQVTTTTGGEPAPTTTGGEKPASEPPASPPPTSTEEHVATPPPTSGETVTPPTSGETPAPKPSEPVPTVTVTEELAKKAPAGSDEGTPAAAPTGNLGTTLIGSQPAKSSEEHSQDALLPTTTVDTMPPGATSAGTQEQVPTITAEGAVGARAGVAALQLTNAFSCGLSVLEHATVGCPGGGGDGQLPAGSAAGLVAAAAAALTGDGGDGATNHSGTRGDSTVATTPVGSGPGSSPGGSTGAATGGSGLGLSAFLTLAGLLLRGAPRLMRRLRISCRQWRATCFTLIPERPG